MNLMDELKKYKKMGYQVPPKRLIKTKEQIAAIRESGEVNTAVLDYIAENIKPGMSTDEFDVLVYH